MATRFGASLLAVCILGSGSASAQTPAAPARPSANVNQNAFQIGIAEQPMNTWFLAGSLGSTFGEAADEAHLNLGGSLGYLWRRTLGFEFNADFAPDLALAPVDLNDSQVGTYMLNAIAAVPIGEDAAVQPFLSGGIGAVTLRSDDDEVPPGAPGLDDNRFGFNIGGGLMAFRERWGFRADIRFYRAVLDESEEGPIDGFDRQGNLLLPNLDFWRANIGVAYRW
jgi:opacity protein-like surface antigen